MSITKKMSAAQKKRYDNDAAELRQVKENIKQAEKRKVELETTLKSVIASGDTVDLGTMTVEMRETRRLDAATFSEKFPVETHSDLYKVVLDNDAVKEAFAPKELEKFKTVSTSVYISES